MGIIDGILGNLLGGALGGGGRQADSPLMQIALQMLQQNGGLEGILGKFRQSGYGAEADSWVSTGQNLPVSGDVLQQVLGSGAFADIARQLGMSRGDAAGGLAQALPDVIDRMTPQGRIPAGSDDLVAQALDLLTRSKSG